jgi:hypothetical protein
MGQKSPGGSGSETGNLEPGLESRLRGVDVARQGQEPAEQAAHDESPTEPQPVEATVLMPGDDHALSDERRDARAEIQCAEAHEEESHGRARRTWDTRSWSGTETLSDKGAIRGPRTAHLELRVGPVLAVRGAFPRRITARNSLTDRDGDAVSRTARQAERQASDR